MSEDFQYRAFGLNIYSELDLPDLNRQDFQQEDVRIVFGNNPSKLSQINAQGVLYQASKNQFLFTMDGVASFHVKDGNFIIIDLAENASLNDVRLFLLGPVFGALLLQKEMLPLHGSSVLKNGCSTIFCGKSGAGKSTLAALLSRRGYYLLADDISIVHSTGDISSVTTGITHLKLWQDVVQQLYGDYSRLPRVREQLLRYKVRVDNPNINTVNRLQNIVILEKNNNTVFEWEEVFGMQKFSLVKDHTYREQYIKGLETTLPHFHQINALIGNVRVYLLRRPDSSLLLNELADFVEVKVNDHR